MAGVPGKGARIAGQDYCYGDDRDTNDFDLGPGGLTVENSKGGAAENDQEARIKGGR